MGNIVMLSIDATVGNDVSDVNAILASNVPETAKYCRFTCLNSTKRLPISVCIEGTTLKLAWENGISAGNKIEVQCTYICK